MLDLTAAPAHSARNNDAYATDLPLASIVPSALNPRKHFAEEALQELAASIRTHGVLEPVLVRIREDGLRVIDALVLADRGEPAFELIAGERRYRASQLAGLEVIPARILKGLDDRQTLELMLVENLQRQDLDPLEEARGYQQLNRVCGLKQAQIAAAVNRAQPTIANRMRLLELPEDVQTHISEGRLSPAHGVAIARFKDYPAIASSVASLAVERKVPSKQIEEKMPFAWELEQGGAIAQISYDTKFDTSVCKACPFGAYRHSEYNREYCLRPEHYKALNEAAIEAKRARALAQMETEGGHTHRAADLPRLSDLGYDNYQRLERDVPPGCEPQSCQKAGYGLDYDKRAVRICTDPRCHKRLTNQEAKRRNKALRVEMDEIATAVADRLESLQEIGPAEIMIAASALFDRYGDRKPVIAAFGQYGQAEVMESTYAKEYHVDQQALRTLVERMRPLDLVRACVLAVLSREINNSKDSGQRFTSWTDWYLGPEPAEASSSADA